ncbi:YoaK family protein [Kitasatospora sp. NPDC085879]|uniref:YoaK family protein n=1 Tax=Kitasatospora sp. NPDC085879 TaxID=3154769 RepID=UPI00344675BC
MPATTRRPDPHTVALLLMTAVTGLVEAASFLGLGHVYTAVMTGNILFLGFGLGGAHVSVVGAGLGLAAFSLGALLGHLINDGLVRRRGELWTPVAVAGVGMLLAVGAVAATGVEKQQDLPSGRALAVLAVMALAMGWRNAIALRIAAPDLPTTVLTRGLTGLLRVHAEMDSRERQAAAVVVMCGGAALGALLLRAGPALPLAAAAAVELASAAVFAVYGGREKHAGPAR